jgi:hypothetical protein
MRPLPVTRDRLPYRLLVNTTIYRTRDRARAERSRFAYKPGPDGWFHLSLLGFLHGAVGLTLWVEDRP